MLSKTGSLIFLLLSLLLLFACTTSFDEKSVGLDGPVPILGLLSGDLALSALKLLPLEQQEMPVGYFSSQKQFDAVVQAIKVDDKTLPVVDFSHQIVLFVRNTTFYNRISIAQVKLEQDTLTVISMETRSAKPIVDKVAISLAVIDRGAASFIAAGDKKVVIED